MLKLSSSSMGTYEKCPKQYHYRYIEKPDVPEKDWSHLEFGKCAHRVLEIFHEELIKNIVRPSEYSKVMSKAFKLAWDEFADKQEVLRPELSYLKEIIGDYLNKIKAEGLPEVLSVEMDFKFMIGPYRVRGFIDRIDKEGDGIYRVVDYKTNKNPKYLRPFQLQLYALAIKEVYGDVKKVSGSYVLLKHKSRIKDWDFSDNVLEKARQKVLSIGSSIDTDNIWEKKPSILCNWCDFQMICENNKSWV